MYCECVLLVYKLYILINDNIVEVLLCMLHGLIYNACQPELTSVLILKLQIYQNIEACLHY